MKPSLATLSVYTIMALSASAIRSRKVKRWSSPEFRTLRQSFSGARLADPLKAKQLNKGLDQLCEEGATQVFRPLLSNDVILGAVGPLQFDVVAHRLKTEFRVECKFEAVTVATARWVQCEDVKRLEEFRNKAADNLALDHKEGLVYVAPTRINLQLTQERWPEVVFHATREQ